MSRGRIGQRPDSGERISYEAPLLDDIAARLDLRVPNREATEAIRGTTTGPSPEDPLVAAVSAVGEVLVARLASAETQADADAARTALGVHAEILEHVGHAMSAWFMWMRAGRPEGRAHDRHLAIRQRR